jgi:hypothetical protein
MESTRIRQVDSSWGLAAFKRHPRPLCKALPYTSRYHEQAFRHSNILSGFRTNRFGECSSRLCNALNDPSSSCSTSEDSTGGSSSYNVTDPATVSSSSSSTPSSPESGEKKTGLATDKWEETLAVHHTLSSLYLRTVKVRDLWR